MDKYYRLKKDTPALDAGAILRLDGDGYKPIDDLYSTPACGDNPYFAKFTIENASDWYERVYPVNLITKTVYKLKEEAREYFSKEVS